VVREDNEDARLAIVALVRPDDAAARLKARGILVNVPDRPDLCDFTLPSILDRDPVLVAVGTSGASAGLAKQLRLRLEMLLPLSLGRLARALNDARGALRAKYPDAAERRQALDAALTQGGALDLLREDSVEALPAWLAKEEAPRGRDHVVLELSSADPDELTQRQARLLGAADVLLVEPGIPAAILNRARADARRLPLPYDGELPTGLIVELRHIARETI
jgi:uroporphyrin-III C-methyltransferase/precorrin-2 dehydrogenase/sirohydrochlorin ferrochelatase